MTVAEQDQALASEVRLPSRLRARLRRVFIEPISLSFGVSMALVGISIITGVLLARELGPRDRGELAAVVLWPSLIASIGALGVSESVTYHTARGEHPFGTIAGTAALITLAQSTLLVLIGAAVVPLVLGSHEAPVRQSALMYLGFIPLNQLLMLSLAMLNGLHRFRWFHGLRLSVYSAHAGGIVVLAAAGAVTVQHVAALYLAAYVTMLVIALTVVLVREHPVPRFDRALAGSIIGYGVRSHWSTVSGIVNERLDQMLISIFLAPVQLGIYVIAVTMTSVTSLVGSSVAMVALPTVSALRDLPAQRRAVRRFLRLTAGVSLLVTLPLMILAPALVRLFFGEAYDGAVTATRILLPATVLLATSRAAAASLKGMGRPLDAGIAEFVALGATLVCLAVLLPAFGIVGAAIASLIAYGVSAAWCLQRLAAALQLPMRGLVQTEAPAESRPLELAA